MEGRKGGREGGSCKLPPPLPPHSLPEAERVETEFSKCSRFLIACLDGTVRRGTFPHRETPAPPTHKPLVTYVSAS